VGLVFASKNFPEIAKVLHSFSKKNESLQFVAGFLEKKVFDKQSVIRIAQLPNKEVLIAQLCGVLQGPARNFASLFHVMIVRLLFVLKQIAENEKAQ
jgi:large subunit ribosomal protein L10